MKTGWNDLRKSELSGGLVQFLLKTYQKGKAQYGNKSVFKKMTIDFKNNRIYHFDKDMNLKEHTPFSTDFKEIEVLPNGKILVVENYYKYQNDGKSNLYCLNQEMELEWFLPVPNQNPSSMDNYVGFTTNGNRVFANTFSCYRVEIDTEKGQIRNVQFTK